MIVSNHSVQTFWVNYLYAAYNWLFRAEFFPLKKETIDGFKRGDYSACL
jgi:hypothetical protein